MYADPGYLRDKRPRFPYATVPEALQSWARVNSIEGIGYTGPQHKRIRDRLKRALRDHGIDPVTQRFAAESLGARHDEMVKLHRDMTASPSAAGHRGSGHGHRPIPGMRPL